MQIRVDDPATRSALECAFAAAGYPTLHEGDTIEVVHPELVELRFFLRPWELQHPGATVELV